MKGRFLILSALILGSISLTACNNEEPIENETLTFLVEFSDDFKKEYYINETISYDGLIVKDSRTGEEISYRISPNEGTRLREPGEVTVTIKKDGYKEYTFKINVLDDGTYREEKTIELYSVNDFHGSFIENRSNDEIGMAKMASFLKNEKANGDAVILSAGDMWQGGVESNVTKGKIIVDSMNEIGFDAMTIGNHEFDWGYDVLKENIELMNFPMLGANVYSFSSGKRLEYLEPYKVVEVDGVKLGIIGTGAETLASDITYSVSYDLDFRNSVEYIKDYSEILREEENCDAIILLAHDAGGAGGCDTPYKFEDLTKLDPVSKERYVDAIFLGHDHYRKQGFINGVPYMEGGANGEYLSKITLDFKENDIGELEISDSSYSLIDPYSSSYSSYFEKEDKNINTLLDKYKDELASIDEVICTFDTKLDKWDILDLLCEAMLAYANDPKNESILIDGKKVTAAFHNDGGVRGEVSAGEFTYRDLIKVVPFDNTVCIVKVNNNDLEIWKAGSNTYIDLGSEDEYTYLVTINYLADNVEYPNEEMFNTNVVIQDVFIEYLRENYN